MKPLKGMNQDISSASKTEATYTKAMNFVYGKELDALLQEPGMELLLSSQSADETATGIIGCVSLRNDNFLLFTYRVEGEYSQIKKYTKATNTITTIVSDPGYNFLPTTVLSAATFFNDENQEYVVFTDNVNPIRIINIDNPETDLSLNKLFSEYLIPSISVTALSSAGGYGTGSHFFCVAYELEDGSVTPFHGITGPLLENDNSGAYKISLQGIDLDYKRILVGSVSFENAAILTHIQDRVVILGESMDIVSDGLSPYREASLEELVGSPAHYTTAKTLTIHDNRLYLANLKENQEANFQAHANRIVPLWVYGDTGPDGGPHSITMDEPSYPVSTLFMPDEVYAFYISYTREDGTTTRAYHIPGRPSQQYTDYNEPYINAVSVPDSVVQFDETATCQSILEDGYYLIQDATIPDQTQGTFNYQHLKNDIAIGGADTKFFHTRCTPSIEADYNGAADGRTRGKMGYWENENEFYPDDFPPQQDVGYTPQGAQISFVLNTLAGGRVRHHKMPSLVWLGYQTDGTEEGLLLDNYNVEAPKMLAVEFDHVGIPPGCVAARIYHAKRSVNNSTVLDQAALFHGHPNSYSHHGAGATNAATKLFSASLGINGPNRNFGDIIDDDDDYYGDDLWKSLKWNKGRIHPPAMMRAKLAIARNLGTQYIKQEYMLCATDSETGDTTTGSWEIETWAEIAGEPNEEYIQTLYDNGDTGTEFHNRNEIFDSIHNSNFTKGQNRLAVLPIKNSSYVAAGIINYLDEWDNRNSEEALCFDIDWQDGILHPIYGGSWTDYQIWLNTPINHYANHLSRLLSPVDLALFGGDEGSQAKKGIWMDGSPENPTSTVAITNYCTYRRDVYTSYTEQTLVACSDVITVDTLHGFTVVPGLAGGVVDATLFQNAFEYFFGYSSAGRVGFEHCYGDVAYGSHRVRTTSQVGIDRTYGTTMVDGTTSAILIDPPLLTFSSNFATIRIAQYFPLMSPINPYFIDTLQSEMGDYAYVNRSCDPIESNDYSYSTSFLKLNDFRQPGIFEKENMAAPALPYRVARSAAQTNDSKDVNLRRFPVLDTYEQTRSRGEIVNIQSFNDKLIIHHALGLFITRGQEKLATSTGEITFGDGDIFATKPIEVIPTTYGYGGTQHQLSCALTPNGYFFVDESQGRIFQYTDKLVDIGRAGLSNFLKNNLKVRKDTQSSEAIVGLYPGIQTSYDPWFERVIFHVRNWEGTSTETNAVAYTYPSGGAPETGYYDDQSKTIKDFYLSFTPSVSSWTSFHNYNTLSLISTRDTLYSINTNNLQIQIYQHNSFSEPVGNFGGERKMAYIDVAFPFGQGAILSDFNWYTKVVDGNPDAVSHKEHDVTFTHAMVSNDYQCSGNITLIRTARGENGGDDVSGNMRRTDYKWYFNEFRDLVDNRALSFIDDEGAAIDDNIDEEKPWNEQKRFVGNFANVRLTLANSMNTTNALYLYDVDAKVRKSYR